jgi:flagellar FliL protein
MILLVLFAQPLPDGSSNVALDDERLQDDVPKGLQKVELDLDDALFLEFEEKEEEEPLPPETAPEQEEETAPVVPQEEIASSPGRKKYWIMGIAALLCLMLGAGGSYFFMKSALEEGESAQPLENPTSAKSEATGPGQDTAGPAPEPAQLVTHRLDKFQVEFVHENQIRFLSCGLSIPNVTEVMRLEMQAKSVFIRDGIYRYLKNAPLSFLDNPNNSDKLKKDLVAVVNQHMRSGTVTEILLEEYVVR